MPIEPDIARPLRSRWLRRAAVVTIAGVVAVVGSAALRGAVGGGDPEDMSPVGYAPSAASAPAGTPTGAPGAVLAALLERGRAAGLTINASLGLPTGNELAYSKATAPGALWLTEHITAPAPGPASMGAIWRATMLAGALRDALEWQGGPPLAGVRIDITDLNDGHTEQVADGEISGAPGQVFAAQSAELARASVLAKAAAAGLTVSEFRVITVLQPAVELVVRVPDAATWIQSHSVEQLLFGSDTTQFEGIHVEIDDAATGKPAYAAAWSYRTADSYGWAPGPPPGFIQVHP